MGRREFVNIDTLFPQRFDQKCCVCETSIQESRRRRYCSDRCRDVAYATQELYNWKNVRAKVLERDGYECQRCGKNREKLGEDFNESLFHVDHKKPVSEGGAMFDPSNLQVLCKSCNLEKSDKWTGEKDLEDFLEVEESA